MLKIGIIGAGFSGTALAANLNKLTHQQPIEIILFEKNSTFGLGDAYRTPYPFHLLNVRANDMSAFQDEPNHFVTWLQSHPEVHSLLNSTMPVQEQFVPRLVYGRYLQSLLQSIPLAKLTLKSQEVVDIEPSQSHLTIISASGEKTQVHKVILALGNPPPAHFTFSGIEHMPCINNSWDYRAIEQIDSAASVMIVGTGLSMIDAVLSLYHQQHRGRIYAVSRHGLLPLAHAHQSGNYVLDKADLPTSVIPLVKYLRDISAQHIAAGGDWRAIINAVRHALPTIWAKATKQEQARFIRHVLSYWNIHRHRVPTDVKVLLGKLMVDKQLHLLKGRVMTVENKIVNIKLRHQENLLPVHADWLINCMGPSLSLLTVKQPLIQALFKRKLANWDELKLGLSVSADGLLTDSTHPLYLVGPLRKGCEWETGAVPEIRKQCFDLAKQLLNQQA